MKSTKTKLAVLGAAAVVVALLASAVAFNLFAGWKVESDATSDLNYALYLSDEEGTGRTPNAFMVSESYELVEDERQLNSPAEKLLATWFAQHPTRDVVQPVALTSGTCYAAIISAEELQQRRLWAEGAPPFDEAREDPAEQFSGYYILYVDTSSDQSLIGTVNLSFALIGAAGAALAALAGSRAGRRIEQAQEAQKRFYENMSHDLKTPLAAIRGYAEGAAGGVVDADEAMSSIVRETDRMTNTINQILGLSRLESGAVHPRRETLVVEEFVQDCLMPLEGAVRAKGLAVELDLADGTIQADPAMLDHALSNVLTNAVRHAARTLRITYDGASLRVFNDGGAPAAEQLPRMFDRFYAGEGGSTGVGLAIAKEVALLHGWSIKARAVTGGLEVVFTF